MFMHTWVYVCSSERERERPAKEIKSVAVSLSHVPKLLERELIRHRAGILAEHVLKVCRDIPTAYMEDDISHITQVLVKTSLIEN